MEDTEVGTRKHKLSLTYTNGSSSRRPSLDDRLTEPKSHSSILRSNSDSRNNPHQSTISLASTFSEYSTHSEPSSRGSRALSGSSQSWTTYDHDNESASRQHPLSQMGAGRFWAPGERRSPRISLQQARDRIRLPKDFRWSDPNKLQQPQSPQSPDRDRVAEAREWIETQCMTAGFGDLDLSKPPSPGSTSRKSSVSLAPNSRIDNIIASKRDDDIATSAQDLQSRIDVLSERIAQRERKIRTRQQLEMLQAEEAEQINRVPPFKLNVQDSTPDSVVSMVELDSRSIPNMDIMEEIEENDDELPRYSEVRDVSVEDIKDYRPPPEPHPAFAFRQPVEPSQTESLDRSRSNSLTPRPVSQGPEMPVNEPVSISGGAVNVATDDKRDIVRLGLPNRLITHHRTLSAPGDRPGQPTMGYHTSGRGRSVSIDTRNLSPTMSSPVSSTATSCDAISTAATTPSENIKASFLTAEPTRPPPPPPSVPVGPIVYCSDPIALSPEEHPSDDSSLFSELENFAGAYRIKPRASMTNLNRNMSHASQAPIPVRGSTAIEPNDSYRVSKTRISTASYWAK